MHQTDCAKGKAISDFLKWAWSDAGTKDATDLNYVPLPDAVKQQGPGQARPGHLQRGAALN